MAKAFRICVELVGGGMATVQLGTLLLVRHLVIAHPLKENKFLASVFLQSLNKFVNFVILQTCDLLS